MPSPAEAKEKFRLEGIPAIVPQTVAQPGTPAFTSQDVAAYLQEHPFQFAASRTSQPTIQKVEFLSAREAGERIRGGIALPDDHLVCLVTLTGDLDVNGEFTGTTGYMVFDALSGNLLNETVHP
jgi:hypothetical protein